ncbi:MAG: 7TM diverse intracellular signaling domain-containing protein [Cytophagales bacterium]|nr:7TM diverse intracellular signaling domain-containing protein [Cytophagales bacterium]
MYAYIDSTGTVTIDDIVRGKVVINKKFYSGYYWDSTNTQKPLNVWYKLALHNLDSAHFGSYMLELFAYSTRKVWIYTPNQDGSYEVDSMGMAFPFHTREYKHKNPISNIIIPANAISTVYVRCYGYKKMYPSINVRSTKHFLEYTLKENYEKGVFNGFFMFVTILNLFFFIFLREPSYFLYIIFTLFQTIFVMNDGFGFQFHWPHHPEYNPHIMCLSMTLMMVSLILFNVFFLKIQDRSKPIFYFFIAIAIFRFLYYIFNFDKIYMMVDIENNINQHTRLLDTALMFILLIFILYETIIIRTNFHLLILLGHISFFLGLSYALIRQSVELSNYYPIIISNLVTFVDDKINGFFFHICSVLHILFVSVALVERIKGMKSENEHNKEALIKELEKNKKIQENINQELEAKVKIRTEELNQQKEEIQSQNDELSKNAQELEAKAQEIKYLYGEMTDSIETAKRIQNSILPSLQEIKNKFADIFILFKPKDIVSGDFYWFYSKQNLTYIAAADCTGHGVAGAFMSMVAHNLLNTIVSSHKNADAGVLLTLLSSQLVKSLHQDTEDEYQTKDGLDIALCIINSDTKTIQYAGANNSMYILKDDKIDLIQATKRGVGYQLHNKKAIFATETLTIDPDAVYYIYSDGFASQFGGVDGQEKMKFTRFRDILLNNHKLPLQTQHYNIDQYLTQWMGNVEQTDDILLIGFKLL